MATIKYIYIYISKIESCAITWDWEPLSNECARGVRAATVKTRLARRPWHPACDRDRRRDGTRRDERTALFTPYWVRTLKTVHGTSRCVSIIATFILSFPRHGILSFAYIRYVMATLKRGIVQVARVCCTTVCPPSARWIADDGYQEGQDGCF